MHAPKLTRIYLRLHRRYGPQMWWPADTPFEMITGAFLTQNSAWTNVEKALANLKSLKILSVAGIRKTPLKKLAAAIRPSGYFNQKAARLKDFVAHLDARHGGSLAKLLKQPAGALREELLSIRGIGPETADSIVLYAAHKPSFVVDAYTRRIFGRLGLVENAHNYDQIRDFFQKYLKKDVPTYNEYHALIVRHAKEFCHKNTPACGECCLGRECLKRGVEYAK